jgi:cytoskeletal protein CcmA (bactofilin family)
MDIEDFKTTRFNILGHGTRIKGELHFFGRSSVSGEIEGELVALEGSYLILEKTANVKGEISAFDVEIHGIFEGTITARGTLSLKPGSTVSGKIKATHLVVYPGAQLNSECESGI